MKTRRNGRRRSRITGESLEPRHLLSALAFVPHDIVAPDADGASSVQAADLDGDGDDDVLSASWDDDKIAWYENVDGKGTFGRQQIISQGADGALSVAVGDLDGDGDLDVLSASSEPNAETGKIAWYENRDGAGSFGPEQVITTDVEFSTFQSSPITVSDLDEDGDLDVLSASWHDDKIAWYENTDGAGSFGPQQVITTDTNGALSAAVGDLDGDGDLDVLSASSIDDKIAWYENTERAGRFGLQQVITTEFDGATSVTVGDLDGDGDLDVVSASWGFDTSRDENAELAWYENTDGAGSFRSQQVISHVIAEGAESVTVADVDGDGDLDVLATLYYSYYYDYDDEKIAIAWYENTDGSGSFVRRQVITAGTGEFASVTVGDLDGDGDLDILSSSRDDNTIAWYENRARLGSFTPQQVTGAAGASAVAVGDLDGDGDLEILSASGEDDEIAWYENTDGLGSFGTLQVISTEADGADWLTVSDLDSDGDLDVLSASWEWTTRTGKIAWHENLDGAGSFGPEQVITTDVGFSSVYSPVMVGDLDGDGDLDILSASSSNPETGRREIKITWYENADGTGDFGPRQVITTDENPPFGFGIVVSVGDLDGDGDLDVLSGSLWFENTDGTGSFGPEQVIAGGAISYGPSATADLDGDGDLDVVGSGGGIGWHENTDGAGSFRARQTLTNLGNEYISLAVGDMDGDGDPDVLSAMSGAGLIKEISWYENTDGLGSFTPGQVINADIGFSSSPVVVGDLDGDGDLDVISTEDGKIAWYENRVRVGSLGPQQVITTFGAIGVSSVTVGDLDGDDDFDVLSASSEDAKAAWYENTDGLGSFGPQQVVTTQAENARSLTVVDLDGDGDLDVLSGFSWYENTDGTGNFGSPRIITTNEGRGNSVTIRDLDGDGDLDRDGDLDVLDGWVAGKIAWYENTDGVGSFGPRRVISDFAGSVTVVDLDGDGNLDVLEFGHSRIAWYENTDGAGSFGPPQVISSAAVGSVTVSDLDGDGDLDVLDVGRSRIAWYENTDGVGSFGPPQVISSDHGASVTVVDLDGDGDLDLAASAGGDRIGWYENHLAADADDDGEVAFQDFVTLANNFGRTEAVWEDGDFDGDGAVNFSDFVILADNFGQTRPQLEAASVPEGLQPPEVSRFANASAIEAFFGRFDDELTLQGLV